MQHYFEKSCVRFFIVIEPCTSIPHFTESQMLSAIKGKFNYFVDLFSHSKVFSTFKFKKCLFQRIVTTNINHPYGKQHAKCHIVYAFSTGK